MDKEVLEVVLKKLAKESGVAKVLDLESVPALSKGENYTSTILRVTAKVVLGNGRLAKKSFIMKQIITEGDSGELMSQYNVAAVESKIYTVVHKNMTYLMEEFEDTDETLWCNFIHHDPKASTILLEDLKVSGYSLVPRHQGLDLEHAILVLRSLGRYHGMAKVLEERGVISKNDYKIHPLFIDEKLVRCYCYAGIKHAAKVILDSWGPTWEETANKLKMMSYESYAKKHMSLAYPEESEFTVLNHGDCWSNNMMFKYDFQKRPIALKFLDYQGPHHNSPCFDITYFMHLSIQPDIRRSNYEFLLKTYHDALVRTLDKFGFSGTKPTLQDITAAMERVEFFGLEIYLVLYPGLVAESKMAFDLEKILATDGEEGFDESCLKEPGIIEKMGPDIIKFVENHVNRLN